MSFLPAPIVYMLTAPPPPRLTPPAVFTFADVHAIPAGLYTYLSHPPTPAPRYPDQLRPITHVTYIRAAHLAGEICLGARSMSFGSLSLWRLWCRWCLCLDRCSSRSLLSPPPSGKGGGTRSPAMPPSSGLYRLLPRPFTLLAAYVRMQGH